jgi:hypothetical protein
MLVTGAGEHLGNFILRRAALKHPFIQVVGLSDSGLPGDKVDNP